MTNPPRPIAIELWEDGKFVHILADVTGIEEEAAQAIVDELNERT